MTEAFSDWQPLRSFLFVPGDKADWLDSASECRPDGIIADLEDGVAPKSKPEARRIVGEWLETQHLAQPERWVRVNSDNWRSDLSAISGRPIDGIFIPKANDPTEVEAIGNALADSVTSPKIIALIESSSGIRNVDAIASVERVVQLMIGEVDLAADLGLDRQSRAWVGIRSELVIASSAARIAPPLAPVGLDFQDVEAFRSETNVFRRDGFWGRAAIHPKQVASINSVFTPTAEEVKKARDTIAAFRESVESGRGAFVDEGGSMVDEAVVRSARRLLALARPQSQPGSDSAGQ